MLAGAHMIIYSADGDAARTFLRDVLGSPYVDVGRGWLIFALPESEIAVHPADKSGGLNVLPTRHCRPGPDRSSQLRRTCMMFRRLVDATALAS